MILLRNSGAEMRKLIILIALFCFSVILANSQDEKPKMIQAKISLKPSEVVEKNYFEQFFTKEITVLNRGGELLVIKSITGSCKCATATILNSTIEPMTFGKIMLNVNLSALDTDHYIVEYVIESNASNSPTSLKVTFDNRKADSLKNEK